MIQVQIDGKSVQVKQGSNVIEAAHEAGVYIPHFCYHKKLSIAANCRMCLVDIEKSRKPSPACATPVTDGMVVTTNNAKARGYQKGALEFLLIHHPLDCPVCDKGGECQLQDLTVGYGSGQSRYVEEKRVVVAKYMGPLVSAQEMQRCIHCTRCVRFSKEIAGYQEIGILNRGDRSEITEAMGRSVTSELSGNVIDLCPVGALTSKPFRNRARPWELTRRRSVSPHDSLGSNLTVQTKNRKVMRVLPLENEEINECWLSDRDRFSYEGLSAPDRLVAPQIKQDGKWIEVNWETALSYVAKGLKGVKEEHGAGAIGFVANPGCTVEELFLAQKIAGRLGVSAIDCHLREIDRRPISYRSGARWLGVPVASLEKKKAIFVIGANLRQEQPLLAARIRRAAQTGCKAMTLGAGAEDLRMPTYAQMAVHPALWAEELKKIGAEVGAALKTKRTLDELDRENAQAEAVKAQAEGREPVEFVAKPRALKLAQNPAGPNKIAEALANYNPEDVLVLLGAEALNHADAYAVYSEAQAVAAELGCGFGVLPQGCNMVGAEILRFEPTGADGTIDAMIDKPRKAVMLLNVEPTADMARGAEFSKALDAAETVAAFSVFDSPELREKADALLPISPFTETRGTYVNLEGKAQSFFAAVECLGESKPLWKQLRVLGNMLGLDGFEYHTTDEVLAEARGLHPNKGGASKLLDNKITAGAAASGAAPAPGADGKGGLTRAGGVGMYYGDALVRRAGALQQTVWAKNAVALLHPQTLSDWGLKDGGKAEFSDEFGGKAEVAVRADASVAQNVVYLPQLESTRNLGSMMRAVKAIGVE